MPPSSNIGATMQDPRVDKGDPMLAKSNTVNAIGRDSIDNGTIEAFGYVPVYRRVIGTLVGFCIVVSLTAPLGAILVVGIYQVSYAGYWGLSWGWIIPNVLMIPQVIAISELCSSMPVNGGFYWWAAALAPPKFSRPVAFITGWFNILSLATSLTSFSYAVASSLTQAITFAAPDWQPTRPITMAIAMGVVTLWAVLMIIKLEKVSVIMIVTAAVTLLSCVAFIIALPVSHATNKLPFASASDVFGNFTNYSSWETGVAVSFSFYSALWVNSIWTAPAYVAEETHNARVEAPKAMWQSFWCTAVVGMVMCLIFAFCIHDMEMIVGDPSGFPLFAVLIQNWGRVNTAIFTLVTTPFAMIGGSGMLLTYSTQVAAFARDQGLPFSSTLAHVYSRSNMPLNATVMLLCLVYLLLLLSLSQNASDAIYSMASLASIIITCIPVTFRVFAGDRWVPGPWNVGRWSRPVHVLTLITSLYFLIVRSFPAEKSLLPLSIIVVLGALVLSSVGYLLLGSRFKGLDLESLTTWRREN